MKRTNVLYLLILLAACSPKKESEKASVDSVMVDTSKIETGITDSQPPSSLVEEEIDSTNFEFKDFVKLFENERSIPDFAVRMFMQNEVNLNGENPLHLSTKEVQTSDSRYLLFYKQFIPAGPGMDVLKVNCYDADGALLSSLTLGESYDNGESKHECTYSYYVNNRGNPEIETIIHSEEGDIEKPDQPKKLEFDRKFYQLNDKGVFEELKITGIMN
jgi:hypothetical protein